MAKSFFIHRRPHEGMTPAQYMAYFAAEVPRPSQYQEYLRLNYQRSTRITKTYGVSPAVCAAISTFDQPQIWLILTEAWCGDSAQCVPYITKVAACNTHIDVRILLRDQNTDIMAYYLTNGKQSIPKLVAFDETGNELFEWGPRPRAAQELFDRAAAAGKVKAEIYPELHAWYAKDKGRELEKEFLRMLTVAAGRSLADCVPCR